MAEDQGKFGHYVFLILQCLRHRMRVKSMQRSRTEAIRSQNQNGKKLKLEIVKIRRETYGQPSK